MAMFRDVLWRSAEDTFEEILLHPFLVELGSGTLPSEKFAYFLGQDYLHLEDFARVLALGAARSPKGEGRAPGGRRRGVTLTS